MNALPAETLPFAIVLAICAPAVAIVIVGRLACWAIERAVDRRAVARAGSDVAPGRQRQVRGTGAP